jgi:hypothetical protein
MSAPVQIAVTFDAANRKRDKSVGLRFTSNLEITTDDYMQMDRLLQSEGWLLFSPSELQEADIPAEPAQGREGKSRGQRLRAINFLIWQRAGTDEPFEIWYDRRFERMMDKLKEQLD